MENILVLGGNFAGLASALKLRKKLPKRNFKITVISKWKNFVYIPSLPWLILGKRKPQQISIPLTKILSKHEINFIHSEVVNVDSSSKTVTIRNMTQLAFDYLIIATGSALDFDAIEGLGPEKGFNHSLFTLEHAIEAERAWQSFVTNPGPLIVGAVQGASCFGAMYEVVLNMDTELRRLKIRSKVPMTFITSEPYLGYMGLGGVGKSRRFLEDKFAEKDIKFITNTSVAKISDYQITLEDETTLPFHYSLLLPAYKGESFVINSSGLGNDRGFIPVNKFLQHQDHPHIYAAGVSIAIPPVEETPIPTGVPKTGHMSEHMGLVAAENIIADIYGKEKVATFEMRKRNTVCLMDTGNSGFLMSISPIFPPREKTIVKEHTIFHWGKILLEKYFMWKMSNGYINLP